MFLSVDLVPKENVEKWLKYLRNEFPTVAFKASTQTQQEHLVGKSEMLDPFVKLKRNLLNLSAETKKLLDK